MNANPEVMRFFPDPMSRAASDDLVDRIECHFEDKGHGFYAVEELKSGAFIGFIGFGTPRFEASFTPCTEIGWRLDNKFWGQGYATEGALACLDYGFDVLGISELYAFTPTYNKPSERVMQKIGMVKVGEFDHPLIEKGHRLERHLIYQIKKSISI